MHFMRTEDIFLSSFNEKIHVVSILQWYEYQNILNPIYTNILSKTFCTWSVPSHYQNQCCNIVNKTLRNKLQWIFSRNTNIFIQENAFESVVCKKATILYRPQWVKYIIPANERKLQLISGLPGLLLERFRNPTITDTITASEQPHVTSSLSVFVNANSVESCLEKRVQLVQFLGELLEFKLN